MSEPATSAAPLADELVERRVLSTSAGFAGNVWSVRTDVVDLDDGQHVVRDVISHPGAVGIIAIDDEMRVLLVRQYRHPVSGLLWEPPAGLLDVDGEDPRDTAARELHEEAGYRAASWAVLVDVYTSPGGSDEALRIYLARDVAPVREDERHVGDGEERDMPARWVPLADARAAVLAGRLHSPTAVAGVLAASAVLLDGAMTPRPADAPWLRARRLAVE